MTAHRPGGFDVVADMPVHVRFTAFELREFRQAIAAARDARDIARHQARLVSAIRLHAITAAGAADLRRAIAQRITELRAAR